MKLTIVGLGIRGTEQLSLEGVKQIKAAKKVCYLPAAPKKLESALRSMGVEKAEDLLSLYRDGDEDNTNYERIFQKVMKDCAEFGEVALLVPGHPRVGVSLVQWFEQRKEELQLDLQVLPGISSFATMINDLKRDPLERGSVMVDANRMLLFDHHIETSMDYYVYHVCSVGTSRVHLSDASKDNRWDMLRDHLLKFYPASHRIVLVGSAHDDEKEGEQFEATVETIGTLVPHIHFGTTLFIPAATPKRVNREYLRLLKGKA